MLGLISAIVTCINLFLAFGSISLCTQSLMMDMIGAILIFVEVAKLVIRINSEMDYMGQSEVFLF